MSSATYGAQTTRKNRHTEQYQLPLETALFHKAELIHETQLTPQAPKKTKSETTTTKLVTKTPIDYGSQADKVELYKPLFFGAKTDEDGA